MYAYYPAMSSKGNFPLVNCRDTEFRDRKRGLHQQPPSRNHSSIKLLDDFGNNAGTNGTAAFTDG
ncbi:hypothetical protein, partial [Marinobacter xestospongiae]